MNDYKDKIIWIIGASSGIGAALAKDLSIKGARVIISARGLEKLNLVKGDNANIDVIAFDTSDDVQVKQQVDHVFQSYGVIDSVVYMAALYNPSKITSMSIKDVKDMMDVNFMGAFHTLHFILPYFIKQNFGQIALCGSVAGYRGLPNGQPYSASKAALMSLAQSLRCEVSHLGIDVKLISPGFVKTPMTDKNDFSMPMMIEPEEAATNIANGLLTSKFEIRFPFIFTSIMKIIYILPDFLYFKLFNQRG